MRYFLAVLCLGFAVSSSLASGEHKPYAGLEKRQISSLSNDDIEELRRGGGWGLALPAELNNHPGPAHVLELREALELTETQVSAFEQIFEKMQLEAIEAGRKLIAAEQALDDGFMGKNLSTTALKELIDTAEKHRAELRFVHLSRHLVSVELLSPHQIERYKELRGYAEDPCASVPEGHNAAMWRKHNGCEE